VTRTFDRRVHFDPKSRSYPFRTMIAPTPLASHTWHCRPHLDQGQDGACVGFGWAHELAARPVVVAHVTNQYARNIYHLAQSLDPWPGEDYDGTSVLAGAKACKQLGHLPEYRWAFSLDEVLAALAQHGPVVLGVKWREGMLETDFAGMIHATGATVGGHCVVARGIGVPRAVVRIRNSWSAAWGVDGDALISWDDLGKLLDDEGEACVPVRRA
jgi:hypothetical protein